MTTVDEQLRALLELVLDTEPEEIDCDDFLHRVAAVFEQAGSNDPAGRQMELQAVSQHLAVCPECREEYDALIRSFDD